MATRLTLVPIGQVEPAEIDAAAAAVREQLGLEVATVEPLDVPASARNPKRGQARAEVLLFLLKRVRPEDSLALGLTDIDLYATGLNFVFGLASQRTGVAVVSVARLRDPERAGPTQKRVATEAVHEVGHLLGLAHCLADGCAMRFSNTLAEADRKGPDLCPRCSRAVS
ncbi:MAG TPA: archaemetzincin family Zn-dependent metalloprotease [Polyangia bacterium]|nr:archaemetzincin family Zn-dependent metalloprotease [Polyangia bacterium]